MDYILHMLILKVIILFLWEKKSSQGFLKCAYVKTESFTNTFFLSFAALQETLKSMKQCK